jgi:hypothetical protein
MFPASGGLSAPLEGSLIANLARHNGLRCAHTAVLNDTLGDVFHRRNSGVHPTNDEGAIAAAA